MTKDKQLRLLIRATYELGVLLREMSENTYQEFHDKHESEITHDNLEFMGEYNQPIVGFEFSHGCLHIAIADWHGKPVVQGSVGLYDEAGYNRGFMKLNLEEDFI